MNTTREQFKKWLDFTVIEDCDLEFKEAKSQFSSSRGSLFDYCAAIANGNGGKLILGVREKPRGVVGTQYKTGTHNQLSHEIWERLRIHVDVEEFYYNEERVLVFHIPKHPAIARVKSGGKGDKYTYPVRRGESLGEMDDQKTREILNENQQDFTAKEVAVLSMDDLDKQAIGMFRGKWAEKTRRQEFLSFDDEKILKNSGLIEAGNITFAALILAGKEESLRKISPRC